MKTVSIVLAFLLTSIATIATAGTPTPVAPAGMGCALVDSDSCTNGPWVSLTGVYAFGVSGSFTGTTTAIVAGGGVARTLTCTGTITGGVMTSGGCFQSGAFPGANVPITLTCTSQGAGVVGCTIEGA